ncbi:radical SAM protein [Nitrospira sp. KM1]|uniref:PA0069 family radical SAM protein n=1 Tax=Nitrospira sp. KM1 TaxID=1936990 RepID=UPI0013A73500|nr:PA0069 family radical SAM protein [Nitrospira sp. KM1]BCA53861.1 radical SAM protein [Nitrospira sp. KM1]
MRTIDNPPNPFESQHRDLLEPAPHVRLQLYEDATREILSKNESPDLPFRWSLNPYRGCFHACAYCYARPSHEYWGFGAGTDFESKIVIKRDAPQLLRRLFDKPSWKGDLIVFSGNTDCYQPIEASLGITRQCLEICAEYRNPVAIITKGSLVLRDLDVLQQLDGEAWLRVYFSIPFADDTVARQVEPHVASTRKRFEVMRSMAAAGISTGISIAPIIPGLNDEDIPDLLDQAKGAGAVEAMTSLLRLPGSLEEVFLERMAEAFPDRVRKIRHRIQEVRGGAMNNSAFFSRHHGSGPYWTMVEQLFDLSSRKAGFRASKDGEVPRTFRRPATGQTTLF